MHIVTYKCIQKQYHIKNKDYLRFTLNPENEGSKHHRQSTGGCVRLALINIFTRLQSSLLLLSNIVYSKGEHFSYSASVRKV
jgi:predicted neuraminidase